VEVCANLREGGVTPSIGLVSHIVRLLRRKNKTRVHVLCRPRAGDFHYNDEEFEVRGHATRDGPCYEMLSVCRLCLCGPASRLMPFAASPAVRMQVLKKDVIAMKSAGADGVVLGVLKPDRSIDVQRTAKLIAAARPMSVTFHRAFDDVRDPARALADLIKLGADRVLTSGLANTAWEGQHTIRALVHAAQGRITILAGRRLGLVVDGGLGGRWWSHGTVCVWACRCGGEP
jgi:copper homeostasis protein